MILGYFSLAVYSNKVNTWGQQCLEDTSANIGSKKKWEENANELLIKQEACQSLFYNLVVGHSISNQLHFRTFSARLSLAWIQILWSKYICTYIMIEALYVLYISRYRCLVFCFFLMVHWPTFRQFSLHIEIWGNLWTRISQNQLKSEISTQIFFDVSVPYHQSWFI